MKVTVFPSSPSAAAASSKHVYYEIWILTVALRMRQVSVASGSLQSHQAQDVLCCERHKSTVKRTQIHSQGNLIRMLDGIRQFGGIINLPILTGRYCHLACAVAKHCACVRLFTEVLYVRYSKWCIHSVQTQNILLINDLNTRNTIHNNTTNARTHTSLNTWFRTGVINWRQCLFTKWLHPLYHWPPSAEFETVRMVRHVSGADTDKTKL